MLSADNIASGAYKSARTAFMRMEAGARALELLRSREPTHGRLRSKFRTYDCKWPDATHLGLSRTSLSTEFIDPTLSGTYRDPEHLFLENSTVANAARWQLKAQGF